MNYMDRNELQKLEKAKEFLGQLLLDSMEASCTDFQHANVEYFIEILGTKNVPDFLRQEHESTTT